MEEPETPPQRYRSDRQKLQDVLGPLLEQVKKNELPWQKPWTCTPPTNLLTKRPYRGINLWLLRAAGFRSPWWATRKQVEKLHGRIKRRAQPHYIVYIRIGWTEPPPERPEVAPSPYIGFIRGYEVFNVQQMSGVSAPATRRPVRSIARCRAIVSGMPLPPAIQHGEDHAFYMPAEDRVGMPPRHEFCSSEEYYATLFHELIHSTGHVSRLNREGVKHHAPFGAPCYSQEELVAEFGAALLCAEGGILPAVQDNSAAYIQGWSRFITGTPFALYFALFRAEKAANYILGASPCPSVSTVIY